jgi:hypothetical protein
MDAITELLAGIVLQFDRGPAAVCVDVGGYGLVYCLADLVVRLIISLAILGGGQLAWEFYKPGKR